jgi:hypothetical protein
LKDAYTLDPCEAVGRELVQLNLRRFEYCQHEWPAGILYSRDAANASECTEILEYIAFTRQLDDGGYAGFLDAFERKIDGYRVRLLSLRES